MGVCGNLEDVDHLFLACEFLGNIWFDIYKWLDFIMVHPRHVSNHLLQFGPLDGFSKKICSIFSSDLSVMC